MAEMSSAFAFWQEKEREARKNDSTKATSKNPSPKRTVDFKLPPEKQDRKSNSTKPSSTKSLPGHNSLNTKSFPSLVGSNSPEVHRPIRRNRPHSVLVLSQRFETNIQDKSSPPPPPPPSSSSSSSHSSSHSPHNIPPRVSPKPSPEVYRRKKPSPVSTASSLNREQPKATEDVDTIKSAPPTIDHRKPSWSLSKNNKGTVNRQPLQSSSSFISYVDGFDVVENTSQTIVSPHLTPLFLRTVHFVCAFIIMYIPSFYIFIFK